MPEVKLSSGESVSIFGALLAVREDGQPVLMQMSENPNDTFLPIFSGAAELREFMAEIGASGSMKVITDPADFLSSVLGSVRVALNPRRSAESGRIRWTEITGME